MDIKNFIDNVCKQIKYEPARESISEELELHINEIKEEYIKSGLQDAIAEEKAVEQMGNAEEIGKKLNKIHRPKLDWKLLILVIILMGFGILISILKQLSFQNGEATKTIFYMVVGLILGIVIYFLDYRKIKKFSWVIYILATIINIFPILNSGYTVNGINYFSIGSLNFHPATVSIPLYIIAFAGFVAKYNKENKVTINMNENVITLNKDKLIIIVLSILSLIFTISIPSTINTIILLVTYLIVGTVSVIKTEEKRVQKLIQIYVPLLILGIIFVIMMISAPYRFERIVSSFKPELDPNGSGYTGMLQKEVLENAKIIGQADTPVIDTDDYIIPRESTFTFIYLIGKIGILPSIILVFTIILLSIKLIINSKNIKDFYGKMLTISIATLYIFQSIAHILMNVNMGIKADVNLPFVSYGGTHFVMSCLIFAIVLSIYRRKNIYGEETPKNIATSIK